MNEQPDFWKNKHVLVTGAAGFIGSNLVERLAAMGAQVTAYCRYNAAGNTGLLGCIPASLSQNIKVVFGDLCSPDALRDCMDGCEMVFHLAALIAIPYSYHHPVHVTRNNVLSTMTVLEACRAAGVMRLIHTSSSEVYGTAQQDQIREDHPLEAQSPYAAGKIACDKLVQSYHLSFGVPAVTLRPFNTYGPRQSARAIIPTIISQALTQKHLYLGAMHPTRDFLFVADTVDAFIKIAQTPGIEGRTYHVGSGQEISIGHLADRILQITGRDLPVVFDEGRIRPTASEVNRLICDASRAKTDLGWSPAVNLDDGLKQTIDWVQHHLDRYRPEQYAV